MTKRMLAGLAAAPLLLGGCGEDATGPEEGAELRIAFAANADAQPAPAGSFSLGAGAQQLVVAGTNGTLTITDVRLIVAEFEIEGPEACVEVDDEGEQELEECEFEAAPSLLDLPLDGGPVVVATGELPPGVYTELKFEIEDLDLDEDDENVTSTAIRQIREQLESQFPGFPDEASMVVVGTFTPAGGGDPRPFTVFVDADIEVELELIPPLVILEDRTTSRTVTVHLDPAAWFRTGGQVLDLSAYQDGLLELEGEVGGGFEVEIEDEDDDD